MNKVDLKISNHAEKARINRNNDTSRATQTEQPAAQTGVTSASEADRVNVSERAATINRLAARASELPDVRQEKVEALRERIESGSYNPSADDIAEAILKDEQ